MYYKLRKTTHGLSSVGFLALASVMGTTVNAEETVVSDDTTKTEAVRNYISQMAQEDTNPYVAEILKNAETPLTSETDSLVTTETPVSSETDSLVTTETPVTSETDSFVTTETPVTSEVPVTSETVTESVVETSTPITSESISVIEDELPTDPSDELILEHITVPEPENLVSDSQQLDVTVESTNGVVVDDMQAAVMTMVEMSAAISSIDDIPDDMQAAVMTMVEMSAAISSIDDIPDDLSAMVGDRLVFRFTPTSKTTPPKISLIDTTDTSKWNLVSYTLNNSYTKPSDRVIISNPYTVPQRYTSLPAETTELDAQLTQEYAGSITYPSSTLQLTVSDLDPGNTTMRSNFAAYGWTNDLEFAKRIIRLNYIETMHVLLNRYSSEYTKDVYDVFDNIYHISTQQFAQVKAAKMRVDEAMKMASITDATTLNYYNDFQKYYKRIETIYNGYNNETYMPNIIWENAVNSYQNTSTDELNKFLKVLPLQIRQLVVDITVIDESKSPSWAGLAYGTREIALNPLYVNVNNISLIVAHEMGHVVDFASTVYDKTAGYKVVNSFSQTPEFREVWKHGFDNYDAYFRDDPEEGFAEGFAQWLAVEYGGASRADMDRVLPGVYDYFNKLANRIFFSSNNYPTTPPVMPTTSTTTSKEIIPFTTTHVEDDTLDVGVTQIRTDGKNGEKVTVTTVSNGVSTPTITRIEPVNQVVAVGTKPTVVTSYIPFETKYTQDENLEANTTRTIITGVNGVKTITTTYTVSNGVAVPFSVVTSITKQPTHQWVAIGTKPVGIKPTVVTNVLPFNTIYVRDDSAVAGSTRVTREGQNGTETLTTTYTLSGSTTVPMTSRAISAPIDKIVTVGTKPTSVTTNVSYATIYQIDDNMTAGTEQVIVNGKDGSRTVNITYDLVDGKAVPKETVTSSDVVNKVVAIGTKPVQNEDITNRYTTIYVPNYDMSAGQTRVKTKGVNEAMVTTTTYNLVDGRAVPLIQRSVSKMVPEVIEVGVKATSTITHTDFATKYVADSNLSAGTKRIQTLGYRGYTVTTTTYKVVDGKAVPIISRQTATPIDEVIVIGTKPRVSVKYVPYNVEYVVNPTMTPGQIKVVQNGTLGEIITTTTYTIVNGQAVSTDVVTTKPAINYIIHAGR